MGRRSLLLWWVLSTLVLFDTHGVGGVAPRGRSGMDHESDARIMPGVVVIKLRENVPVSPGALQKSSNTFRASFLKAGVLAVRPIVPPDTRLAKLGSTADPVGISRIYIGDLAATVDPRIVAATLSKLPDVEYAEPKYIQQINDVPNDPLVSYQANIFTRLNAFNGWAIAKGSPTVIIADVDGGTDWRHEDLIGNIRINPGEDINHNGVFDTGDVNGIDDDGNGFVDDVVGWNFAKGTNDPTGSTSTPQSAAHGTATASHFGAVTNNGKGLAGTSWNCAVLPICTASATTDNDIAFGYEGIIYAYRNGAKVINCSWGGQGGASRFHQDVIDAAAAAGALVVAAAGNTGVDNDLSPNYPSSYRNVLSVGGLNSTDNGKAYFSNYGASVPVYTPSVSIISAFIGGGYGDGGSGTSYSSSLTSGLAGVVFSAHPTWSPGQVAAQLRVTADPVDTDNPLYAGHMGQGRLNLARALSESHPALNLLTSQLRTTKGDSILLPGDTVLYSAQVQNVLFTTATNVQFTLSAADPAIRVIDAGTSLSSVAPGRTSSLPVLRLLVGSVTSAQRVVIRLDWTINGADHDAAVTRALLLPAKPSWYLDSFSARAELFSVRAVNKQVVWAAGGDRSGTTPVVVRSKDGGKSWDDVTSDLPLADLYCICALDSNRAWVGSGDGRIFSTTNGGGTWSRQTYPGTQSPFINGVWMFADGRGYAMGDPPGTGTFVVLRTTNFGATWAHLPAEPTGVSTEAGWNNSFWWVDPDHGWFGSNKSHIWRTTDGGATWSFGSTGSSNTYGVAFGSSTRGFAIHDNGLVGRTTDGGATWGSVPFLTTDQCYGVAAAPGTSWGWVSSSLDVYSTRDTGSTWATESLFPFDGAISHISLVDTTVGWVVTSNGEILKYIPPWAQPHPTPAIPSELTLYQNYPNPFNPGTTITFAIPVGSYVNLTVYDILGRRVLTLVDGWRDAGEQSASFDATGLASGVYLYRVTAGESAAVKRMLLIR